jgi:hypothetical protein
LIIVGSGALATEIKESAEMLDYDVVYLDILKKMLIIDGKNASFQNVTPEFLKLPIILSIVDYEKFAQLPVFRSWSKNRMQVVKDVEELGFTNWVSIAHPSSVISPSAKIGKNVFISANSTISSK